MPPPIAANGGFFRRRFRRPRPLPAIFLSFISIFLSLSLVLSLKKYQKTVKNFQNRFEKRPSAGILVV